MVYKFDIYCPDLGANPRRRVSGGNHDSQIDWKINLLSQGRLPRLKTPDDSGTKSAVASPYLRVAVIKRPRRFTGAISCSQRNEGRNSPSCVPETARTYGQPSGPAVRLRANRPGFLMGQANWHLYRCAWRFWSQPSARRWVPASRHSWRQGK